MSTLRSVARDALHNLVSHAPRISAPDATRVQHVVSYLRPIHASLLCPSSFAMVACGLSPLAMGIGGGLLEGIWGDTEQQAVRPRAEQR